MGLQKDIGPLIQHIHQAELHCANDRKPPGITAWDESNAQKKDLQRQVSTLKRELKALKSIGGEQAEEWDDPKSALEDLRLLYDQN